MRGLADGLQTRQSDLLLTIRGTYPRSHSDGFRKSFWTTTACHCISLGFEKQRAVTLILAICPQLHSMSSSPYPKSCRLKLYEAAAARVKQVKAEFEGALSKAHFDGRRVNLMGVEV
eukprot:5460792-Pleurochrysis_carterae.AAC.2